MMCSVDCPNPIKDCENSNGSMIVKLESSEPRRFHSHHWFHIAEHYLAHPSSFSSGTKYNASSIYIIPPSSSFYSQLTKSSMFFLLLSLPFENIHRAIVINPSQVIACFPHRDIEKFSTSYTYINIQSYQYLEAYKSVSSLSMTNLIPSCVYFNSITTIESSDKNSIKNNCNNVYLAPGKYAYPSTDWFPNAQDSSLIRQRVMNLCPNLTPYNNESKQFILVIYQRDRSRRFVDLDSILSHIRPLISNQWQIRVINHEDEGDTCELYRTLRDANILLTPHGFQSLSKL